MHTIATGAIRAASFIAHQKFDAKGLLITVCAEMNAHGTDGYKQRKCACFDLTKAGATQKRRCSNNIYYVAGECVDLLDD